MYEGQLTVECDVLYEPDGASQILEALRQHGFIVLSGAVPRQVEEAALEGAIDLFSLPGARKESLRSAPLQPGFGPYGEARAPDTGLPNPVERWNLSGSPPATFPTELRSAWISFMRLEVILRSIAELVLIALDSALSTPGELRSLASEHSRVFKVTHYPKSLLGTAEGAVRASVHKDATIVTLLPKATTPGLLLELGDALEPISAKEGEVIVLSGEVLEYVTAGSIRACHHSVETPEFAEGSDRTAFVYLGFARSEATLVPCSAFQYTDSAARYGALPADTYYRGAYRKFFGRDR